MGEPDQVVEGQDNMELTIVLPVASNSMSDSLVSLAMTMNVVVSESINEGNRDISGTSLVPKAIISRTDGQASVHYDIQMVDDALNDPNDGFIEVGKKKGPGRPPVEKSKKPPGEKSKDRRFNPLELQERSLVIREVHHEIPILKSKERLAPQNEMVCVETSFRSQV
ncbi:hypothetical protein NE237_025954 [Protea cynaroides]|uniref:Uncharacterized protein n=1 Tax=Protea cynaroides TaxID=273540 RepID=A0A9Q0H3B7_9MAGN|nr:hypothetical protein NE237_025954 [Protea cynaroides]